MQHSCTSPQAREPPAARPPPPRGGGRAARLEGDLIAHVADMVRLGRGQHRHCLLQQHQARAQDRHHLPPCSAAVGSSAASKARFLDRTCHARSAADRWVKGEHAGPVRCSCNATAPAARLARFPPACDTQSRAGMRPGCAQAPGARSKHRAPAGFELTAARLDRLCRVDERAIGHAARRLHLARAESPGRCRVTTRRSRFLPVHRCVQAASLLTTGTSTWQCSGCGPGRLWWAASRARPRR